MAITVTENCRGRLLRVIQLIKEEPRRLHMKSWNVENIEEESDSIRPACNTAGCIAGWVVADNIRQQRIASGLDPFSDISLLGDRQWDIPDEAAQLLDLPSIGDFAYAPLFDVNIWPKQFRGNETVSYSLKGDPLPHTKEYAKVVIARIRYFLKTGE
jgi:hypothetical protein